MPPTERLEVAIIGAGAAGLAAGAALARRGVASVLFDRDGEVGGTWVRRYRRLHLHTTRRFSGLPYAGMPSELPRYVSKDDYARYLREYAARFDLDVVLGREIERIEPAGRMWTLVAQGRQWQARAVIVATGRHAVKRLPEWPGLEDFSGTVLHSADFQDGHDFVGRRALVIGVGNSGAEIAADLAEAGAARVAIAVRTAPPISSREILGVPVQVFGMLLMPFPPGPVDRVGALTRRLGTGDLSKYGLGKPAWGPFTARRPPVIDVGFVRQLALRRIDVRPEVIRFTRSGVVFGDGSAEDFDIVVAATGFTTGLERLLDVPGVLDERGLPRCGPGGSTPCPGLYFIGFDETPRGALFEVNRDSRPLAGAVARYLEEEPR